MVTHADELGIRKNQIFVGGESAGGGLCAALCMLARDRGEVNIAFQMPLYPMIDDRDTDSSRDNPSKCSSLYIFFNKIQPTICHCHIIALNI